MYNERFSRARAAAVLSRLFLLALGFSDLAEAVHALFGRFNGRGCTLHSYPVSHALMARRAGHRWHGYVIVCRCPVI